MPDTYLTNGHTAADIDRIIDNFELRTGFGTPIVENTDLNYITELGSYYIQTAAIMATIMNIPSEITGGSRLIVMPLNGTHTTRLTQILIPNWNSAAVIGAIYIRQLYAPETWSSWYKFGGTAVEQVASLNLEENVKIEEEENK